MKTAQKRSHHDKLYEMRSEVSAQLSGYAIYDRRSKDEEINSVLEMQGDYQQEREISQGVLPLV